MITINSLLRNQVNTWIGLQQREGQSVVCQILKHIDQAGRLRLPQKEAIENYLWIKFVAKNQSLANIIQSGLLHDDAIAQKYEGYRAFDSNYVAQFLNQFFLDNGLANLHKKLLEDPDGQEIDWRGFLDGLLHNFSYPNYLFSLPMGAGKTFLMACFIYLDLYFALMLKEDKRFAHNFIVFAPHASKTAILPSLATIKDFNPQWVVPTAAADKLKRLVTIEVLDSLSSRRRDKLHGNNPNLEKVNRLKQSRDFGIVFITNAEKVVLEKYDEQDRPSVESLREGRIDLFDQRKLDEIEKSNALREALAEIPNLTVMLDEVHHTYGRTNQGTSEKKLRQAVSILNKHNHINTVIGFTGTPYVRSTIQIADQKIRLNQIQDIVYHYPLNLGIGEFLKTPDIKKADVKEEVFIKNALTDFFKDYDRQYADGATSKIAFYCPSVRALNEEILPVVKAWYAEHRAQQEHEIICYYSKVSKENKQYELPKENLSIFNNLDKPYSRKRVILLVAVGTEGWNCKSLTSVVLPRKQTTKNFVLQTTCRCLREVEDASTERALIYLSRENYETLDKELKDNYHLSISDLVAQDKTIKVQVRKPKLGKIKYKQVDHKYHIVISAPSDIGAQLNSFQFSDIETAYPHDARVTKAHLGEGGLVSETQGEWVKDRQESNFSFNDFLYQLVASTYGLVDEYELERGHKRVLQGIYEEVAQKQEWIESHPNLTMTDIIKWIAAELMSKVALKKDDIEKETEIQLLEWASGNETMSLCSPNGTIYKFMPRIATADARTYQRHPEDLVEDFFSEKKNIDPNDISFNYIPYRMDSEFERHVLEEMLKIVELADLEVYFNGYKNNRLESFWIQTPQGKYTPDFLVIKRKGDKYQEGKSAYPISKVLIIETKGQIYYTDTFKAQERFVKEVFQKHNPHIKYCCFVDDGQNSLAQHMDCLREQLEIFVSET